MISKQQAREMGKKYRTTLDAESLHSASQEICRRCIELIEWDDVRTINVYQNIAANNEVSTEHLLHWLSAERPEIHVFRQSHDPIFDDSLVDVVIVPVVAIDEAGTRVGYGGGNYDRYLADHPEAKAVAFGFEGQVSKSIIKREQHDVPPKYVITEEQIRHFD